MYYHSRFGPPVLRAPIKQKIRSAISKQDHQKQNARKCMNKTLRAALASLLAAGAGFAVAADENEIDLGRTVVTAAGFEQKVADAPASVKIGRASCRERVEMGMDRGAS